MSISYGGDYITDTDGGKLRPSSAVFRNRIINGAMVFDQRNAGASVTANDGTFGVDRFKCVATANGKFTMQQNAGSVTPPVGFTNYLGCTSTAATSLGAGDFYQFRQQIEGYNIADLGWGTANAKTVTLSFQVYSSLTGTFGGSVNNSAFDRSYPFSYSIPVANTWTSISITIAGDTSGTWLKTNTTGLQLGFSLGSGSTYSGTAGSWAGTAYTSSTGATSVVGTSGATFYITGVMLEVGTQATTFDYRSYGTELSLCQRYCFSKIGSQGTGGASMLGAAGNARSTTTAFPQLTFPVTMRIAPSLTVLNPTSFLLYQTSAIQATAVSLDVVDPNAAGLSVSVASGLTSPTFYSFGCNNGNAQLIFSAEL
jgi:hypothetical protein